MIEKELGSFNFAFDIKNFQMKDEFFDIGMFELGFQARVGSTPTCGLKFSFQRRKQ